MQKRRELSALELGIIVGELNLKGARLQKIYQQGKKDFILEFHLPSQGRRIVRLLFPTYLYLAEEKPPQDEPTAFCQALRNLLAGQVVLDIHRHAFERIVVIGFKEYSLVLELFGGGNLLVLKEGRIELILEARQGNRPLKKGGPYAFPVSLDISKLSEEDLSVMVRENSFDSIVKLFALSLALGGMFAEELCLRAKLDKTRKSLNPDEIARAYRELKALIAQKPEPYVLEDDIAPFPLLLHEGKKKTPLATFSEAIIALTAMLPKSKTSEEKERDRLLSIRDQQLLSLHALEESITENTRKAELFFENYTLVRGVLAEMQRILKSYPSKEISERLKGHKLIKAFDPKAKSLKLSLGP